VCISITTFSIISLPFFFFSCFVFTHSSTLLIWFAVPVWPPSLCFDEHRYKEVNVILIIKSLFIDFRKWSIAEVCSEVFQKKITRATPTLLIYCFFNHFLIHSNFYLFFFSKWFQAFIGFVHFLFINH
jgi:hypothetical protein